MHRALVKPIFKESKPSITSYILFFNFVMINWCIHGVARIPLTSDRALCTKQIKETLADLNTNLNETNRSKSCCCNVQVLLVPAC